MDLIFLLICAFFIAFAIGYTVGNLSSSQEKVTIGCTYSEETFNSGYSSILAVESYQLEK